MDRSTGNKNIGIAETTADVDDDKWTATEPSKAIHHSPGLKEIIARTTLRLGGLRLSIFKAARARVAGLSLG